MSDAVDTVGRRMLNLLLARHGQSEWNAVGRWQGQEDPPLSELGRAQARSAAQHAGAFDAVFASDLERALHTATIISTGIGVGPVMVDPRLKERFAGAYQGLTRDEIEVAFPGNLDAGIWPPGWEDDESVLARVMDALADIVEHTGGFGDALAVSHGGVIYTLESHFLGSHERIGNLGGRWLHFDGAWRLGERIELAPENITIESEDIL
jgi:probable phosphoglycerate mutase